MTDATPDCGYEMIPAKANFAVWLCVKEAGHDGNHWIGEFDLKKRLALRDAYAIGGEKKGKRK